MLYACSFSKTVLSHFTSEVLFIVNVCARLLTSNLKIKFSSSYPYGYLSVHQPIHLQFNVVTYTQET